jgi:hypothetical protein
MNTSPSLHPKPDFERYFVVYAKSDPAKEPLSTGESTPAIIADASRKTGRPRDDFDVQEIPKERYEKLKQFLGS